MRLSDRAVQVCIALCWAVFTVLWVAGCGGEGASPTHTQGGTVKGCITDVNGEEACGYIPRWVCHEEAWPNGEAHAYCDEYE